MGFGIGALSKKLLADPFIFLKKYDKIKNILFEGKRTKAETVQKTLREASANE